MKILGKNNGKIDGLLLSVKTLEKEFGKINSKVEHQRLYSIKTSDVISVGING